MLLRIDTTAIETDEILFLQHRPGKPDGIMREDEHYVLVFKNGREIWLDVNEGNALL